MNEFEKILSEPFTNSAASDATPSANDMEMIRQSSIRALETIERLQLDQITQDTSIEKTKNMVRIQEDIYRLIR